jgi:hypothetical protein
MRHVGELVIRALAGGLLVSLFALIGEVVEPKKFAGLFAAAPSVALASLAVTLAVKGSGEAAKAATGMLAGSAGMILYCVLAVTAMRRLPALAGSVVALAGWILVAAGSYLLWLR